MKIDRTVRCKRKIYNYGWTNALGRADTSRSHISLRSALRAYCWCTALFYQVHKTRLARRRTLTHISIITRRNVKGAISSIAFKISTANGVSSSSTRVVRGEFGSCLSRPVSLIILHCSCSEITGSLGDSFVPFAFLRAMMTELARRWVWCAWQWPRNGSKVHVIYLSCPTPTIISNCCKFSRLTDNSS